VARVLLLLMVCLAARADVAEDLVAAARSPYELARFVESHTDFDWAPLWKALGIEDADVFLLVCEDTGNGIVPCSAELITVVEPFQLILILRESHGFQVFLRYLRADANGWHFAGAYAPRMKYFEPEHRLVRLRTKPFLTVTSQGFTGTGVSSKIENWIDLTGQNFKPVLQFTSEGHYSPSNGIGRTVSGQLVSFEQDPVEAIRVARSIEFEAYEDGDEGTLIGGCSDEAVYTRGSRGDFELDPELSSVSAEDIETFYENLLSDYTDADFLEFNFEGLKEVATGDDDKAREWLSNFLTCCRDTDEAKELKALLEARPR